MKTKEKSSLQELLMGTFGDRTAAPLAKGEGGEIAARDAQQPSLFASKPVEEMAVTLRARADGMLQVCRCGGTGEDGCVIDGPLVRTDPHLGFASHSSSSRQGNGGGRG